MIDVTDNVLLSFAFILVLGLFLPELSARWKVATVPFYIIAGIIIGPIGLGFVQPHESLKFIGDMGLYFLVFIAGLEVYRSSVTKWREPIKLVIIFGVLAFAAGYIFGILMGVGDPTQPGAHPNVIYAPILIGIILISSSVGEIIPIINASRVLKERAGHVIIPGVVILDAFSLVGIAFLAHQADSANGATDFFIFVLLISIFFSVAIIAIPRIGRWFLNWEKKRAKEGDLKFMMAVLFVVVAISELIHLHGIVAAFFVGILLGKTLPNKKEFHRIEGIGHSLLIPVFFIVIGLNTDITVLWRDNSNLLLPIGLIVTLMSAKLLSGIIYGRFSENRSDGIKKHLATGVIFFPQLDATIAATVIGQQVGIVNDELFVSVIIMALITATATPFFIPLLWRDKDAPLGAKNHVVLIGLGTMGEEALNNLLDGERDFVVVESNMDKIKRLKEEWVPYVYGSGTDYKILRRAGMESAGLVIISPSNDKDVETMVGHIKKMNQSCRIIARIDTNEGEKAMRGQVDSIIRPAEIFGSVLKGEMDRLLPLEGIEGENDVEE
ncbi:MAG: cation:proton antiporter [Candidatus Thermoplasmatota archaeon]|nr:cation:proton antiporter [Candidatus Thermoplasmatota archaeon]